MKIKFMFLTMSVALSSFATKIPEPKELHSELHTIQFVVAELPAHFEVPLLYTEGKAEAFNKLSAEEKSKTIQKFNTDFIRDLEKSALGFTNLATIYTKPDVKFSSENEDVSGILDSESETLDISEISIGEYKINSTSFDAKSNKWVSIFLGGKIVDGKETQTCVLIKCYKPNK